MVNVSVLRTLDDAIRVDYELEPIMISLKGGKIYKG